MHQLNLPPFDCKQKQEGGKTYMGFPATEASAKRRELVWIKRIPELWKKVMD